MRVDSRPEDFDEIKERLDMASEYGHYIVSKCPFHDDSNPSFFVYPDTYNCKGCGVYGNTENLLEQLTGVYIHKADTKIVNPFYAWHRRFGGLGEALIAAYKYGKEFPIYMDYLRDRGITDETISRMKLGYLDGWITVPVFDKNKKLVSATSRMVEGKARYYNPPKKFLRKETRLYVPDWERVLKYEVLHIVFGIFDAISLWQCGYAAMTTLIGKTNNHTLFDDFRKDIVVIPDKGEETVGSMLVSRLGWRGNLARTSYPKGTKDINDLLKRNYIEEIHGMARC